MIKNFVLIFTLLLQSVVFGQEFSKTQQPYLPVNYIKNAGGESGVTGFNLYADAAGTTPVDGTGGSPTITITSSTTTPLEGGRSLVIFKPSGSSHQGQGVSTDFTISNLDKGKVLQASLSYQVTAGTYADDDISWFIYDVTNARVIAPAPSKQKNSGIIEKFNFEFQSSIDSTSYRLIGHISSTSTATYTVKYDSFVVGSQPKLYGSAVTDWVSYSPNMSSPGILTNSGKWRRVGDSMEVECYIEWNGSGGGGGLLLDIPAGFSIDTAKISLSTSSKLGEAERLDTGVAYYGVSVTFSDSNSVRFMQTSGSAFLAGSDFTAGDQLKANFKVPIIGWSSSQIFSQDADTRVVAALIGGGAASYAANNPIIYSTVGLDTHGAYSTVTGKYTVPVSGYYNVNASGDGTAAAGTFFYVSVNGNTTAGYNRPVIAVQEVVNQGFSGSGKVFATAGQTIDIRATNAAGSISSFGTFQIERISGPAQIASSESVLVRATQSSGQSIANTGAGIDLTWNNIVYDSHGSFNGATGEFTAPISGKYKVLSRIRFASNAWTVANEASLVLVKNGATYSLLGDNRAWATITVEMNVNGEDTVSLLAGDKIKIQAINTRGGGSASLSASGTVNFVTIERVGNY